MSLTKTKLSEESVTIDIDIEKLLGSAASNRDVRETFYQAAYDKMIERLDSGRDVTGKLFAPYSKSYKESLSFAAFGKSKTVNLQLSGDMVNAIDLQKQTEKTLTVGFNDQTENAKAYAHMTGFKGHPTLEGKVKPRVFFGWSDAELKAIAKEFKPVLNKKDVISDEKFIELLDRLIG